MMVQMHIACYTGGIGTILGHTNMIRIIPYLLLPKVFRVAPKHFACLHSTTQINFWGNMEVGHMGTLKILVENFS